MCRWLAYRGTPIYLDSLIFEPEYSLVSQSLSARQAKVPTNGDGFGLGWYAHRPNPGLFRDVLPAWNDANLKSLSQQIRSGLFFAHVRASTGTETSRSNCHPFSHGRWMFMHNGQVGGWERLRRTLEQSIPDHLYRCRKGTTDSEALFYLLLSEGLDEDPPAALERVVGHVLRLTAHAGEREPFRFTAALTDGERTAHCVNANTVDFRVLDADDIRHYIATGEPMDKAGAYGIQGRAAMFITSIHGSYTGIMGLPLYETAALLTRFGLRP